MVERLTLGVAHQTPAVVEAQGDEARARREGVGETSRLRQEVGGGDEETRFFANCNPTDGSAESIAS